MSVTLLKRPRTLPVGLHITSTGHIVGVTYACHDIGAVSPTYRVLGRGMVYAHGARVQWQGGKILDRLRSLRQSEDHPVTQPCPIGACRRRIEGTN